MARANDVDFTFQVGSSEIHQVTFRWDSWNGTAVMTVDGEEVLREKHSFGAKRIRRFETVVGATEVHHVVVIKNKPLLYGAFRKQSFQVLVDDKQVGEY